ncbi:RHS repeat-associated core domain-containing protein [Stenotrophomonas sp. HITSZ_GD]|uniref:RHS repeat domain-containing protein n=1 Tax=Stenotrophomonas sp. HITSZ_GD TaxID=3037248 RepID=UPI00240E217D|nr:RHS repeat-associated core domain-containing protein [Stenotrophomonas sp. HITSZ_GD]MDG2524199.1 RHS repeat-associated core domain-containing protein [Stenotrophomonas sp. HITSZ_GD]
MRQRIRTIARSGACAGTFWLSLVASACAQTVTTEYIHTDALGSPVATTNSSGSVVERQAYEPYGALISHGPTDGPGFTGHVEDSATGLTYMQQRYYDPEFGKFLSTDPVSSDFSRGENFNRYTYVDNNPYKNLDPDGRYKCTAGKACKLVAEAVGKIRASAKAQTGSHISNGRSSEIAKFLGKEGDENGVTIQDGASGSAGNSVTEGGATTISINFSGLEKASRDFKGFSYQDLIDSTLIHEGSHGYDQSMRAKNGFKAMTRSRQGLLQGERRAYKAEAAFYQSLQVASPWGLWTPENGRDGKYIEQQAHESVKISCSNGGCEP